MLCLVTAAPLGLDVTLDYSNNCSLSWTPPTIVKRHGSILEYLVNCSAQDDDLQATNSTSNSLHLFLRPHATYHCCVFAINEIGLGNPACKTLVTFESGKVMLNHALLYILFIVVNAIY